jgi:putative ABC transport system substrate-binding protein
LINPTTPNPIAEKDDDDAARILRINLEKIEVKDQSELADAFDRMGSLGVEGLAIAPDFLFFTYRRTIADLARTHKLPAVGADDFVPAGGLFSYSSDAAALAKRSAWYVDQILKGIPPGDLPAELATAYRLVVNLRAAKELGVTVPPSVLFRADEVIE